ncbi:MAG: LysR family transcriptional regulator [Actinobacteria bacterium]|nr:LysR family transcriptional regulator [Actinomycetota bacterium]MCA1720802.1 LysR family transcriptional regulator [Actinomycetota bacterium]
MREESLKAFVAVARHLHFGKAAAEEFVVVSTLSRRLSALERDTGLVLAVRSARAVDLTPQGKAFLPVAERLLAQLDSGKQDALKIRTAPRGSGRGTAPSE